MDDNTPLKFAEEYKQAVTKKTTADVFDYDTYGGGVEDFGYYTKRKNKIVETDRK